MKYDVYLAAPFFSAGEKIQNELLIDALEHNAIKVFYPLRDGIIAKSEIEQGRSVDDVMKGVWACDTDAIRDAKVILAVLDGRTIDEGVCVEVGYASALLKKIIGYHSDDRSFFRWGMNPMVEAPITEFASNVDGVVRAVLRSLGK